VVNPGRLPLGVTPRNILHASRRRNSGIARIFHDLGLMEREGSGIDLIYEKLLAAGKGTPTIQEGTDSVHVVVPRRVLHPAVNALLHALNERFPLSQRERIVVGLLAQTEGLTAIDLAIALELPDPAAIRPWLDRLLGWGVVHQAGRTKGTRYFVQPNWLQDVGLDQRTSLARIEPHRLRTLILEDLARYSPASLRDIQRRIGPEIAEAKIRRALQQLRDDRLVEPLGTRRGTTYRLI
jgi:ATP-dependent DNA helicase RecG